MEKKLFNSRCTVCVHADCLVINLALARGASIPLIAGKFKGLSTHALRRHLHAHLAGPVLDRLRVRSLASIVGKNLSLSEIIAESNQTLLARITALEASLLGAIAAAEQKDAGALVSSLTGRLTDLMALEARITSQISTGSMTVVNNYLSSDSFVKLRSTLLSALRPFPAAAKAVSAALLAIESPDVVDVEVKLIEQGTGEVPASTQELAIDTAEVRPATLPDVARQVPSIVRTETYVDSSTRAIKLSR